MRDITGENAAKPMMAFKIFAEAEWRKAVGRGKFEGSTDDLRDGFIHLSTAGQVAGTLARHFAGRADLVLVAFPAEALGPALKFEPSRGGALFPHLYGVLDTSLAVWHEPIGLGPDGEHVIPARAGGIG